MGLGRIKYFSLAMALVLAGLMILHSHELQAAQVVRHFVHFGEALPSRKFQYSEKNLQRTPWQTIYAWKAGQLKIGEKVISPVEISKLLQGLSANVSNFDTEFILQR
jgi:hypothetical protein